MLDGITKGSGAIDGHAIQIGYQLADICAISSYSFVVSAMLLFGMKMIPGLNIRVDEESEIMGLDLSEFHLEEVGDWDATEKNNILGSMIVSQAGTPPSSGSEIDVNGKKD